MCGKEAGCGARCSAKALIAAGVEILRIFGVDYLRAASVQYKRAFCELAAPAPHRSFTSLLHRSDHSVLPGLRVMVN
jgi:hypothetical protein